MFARWGRFVYRRRWWVLAATIPFLVLSAAAFVLGVAPNFSAQPPVEAGRALNLIDSELPHLGNSFELVFVSKTLRVSDPSFRAAMQSALQPLRRDSRVGSIQTPYDSPAATRELTSTDGHMALAIIAVKGTDRQAIDRYSAIRALVHTTRLRVLATGGLAVTADFTTYLNGDLARTSGAVLPLALILLLIVFGTVIAALLPLGAAALTLVAGLSGVYILGRITDITQYATNLVALICLGVAIDYSLFIVSRFRQELAEGRDVGDSIAIAVATAGRAVLFSGLTVAIGLSGMFFYQGIYLATMGLAGAVGVLLAVVCALTFLPALLAVLGPRVNKLRLPLGSAGASSEGGFWHGLATSVMRRPVLVLIVTVGLLLLIASPIAHIELANGDIRALPPQAPSRTTNDLVVRSFPGEGQNDIAVVVDYPDGRPLSPTRMGYLYDLSRQIARLPHVTQVKGPATALPGLTRFQAMQLAGAPVAKQPVAFRRAVKQYVGAHIIEVEALASVSIQSDAARSLVRAIRALPQPPGGRLLVTGNTAFDIDEIDYLVGRTPFAVGYILIVTYVILFLLVGSVVLPLKAVVMNLLSISASFGALVWIFQDGHLSHLLNFTPQQIDPTNLVLLFCIVFGLSMDYEVFLLTRVQEQYRRTGETRAAVAAGLASSGRLITGAAAIMAGVFLAFGGLANTVIIKEIGLGLAIAVAMDATIVRGLVVPALMRLMGAVNWWAPAPMLRVYDRLGLGEHEAQLPDTERSEPVAAGTLTAP